MLHFLVHWKLHEINELVSESVFVIVSVKVNCVTLEIINKLIYDFDSTFSISFVSNPGAGLIAFNSSHV